jgi:hypothetical protein
MWCNGHTHENIENTNETVGCGWKGCDIEFSIVPLTQALTAFCFVDGDKHMG